MRRRAQVGGGGPEAGAGTVGVVARRDVEPRGPGPLPAIIGGLLAVFVLSWLVGIVIGTVTLLIRVAVVVAVLWAVARVWAFLSGD